MKNLILTFFILALSFGNFAFANPDQYFYKGKGLTIAISDVHADPDALLDILVHRKVIDKNGNFIGKNIDLVLMGDYTGKGPNTRGVWDVIDFLQKEAVKNNSRVHALWGNHDTVVMMETLTRIKKKDFENFSDYDPDPEKAFKKAMVDEKYSNMMSQWKGMVNINGKTYMHAGIEDFADDLTPEEVNRITRGYIEDQTVYLRKKLKNERATKPPVPEIIRPWEFDSKVPLPGNPYWTRTASKGKMSEAKFDRLMRLIGADVLIVGHTPTKSQKIEKKYGGRLILTDTKASSGMKGKLAALEIDEVSGKITEYNKLKRGVSHNAFRKIAVSKMKQLKNCFDVFRYVAP